MGYYRGHQCSLFRPLLNALSPVPDLDCESDLVSLWFSLRWEEPRYWQPDGSGKRRGIPLASLGGGSITYQLLRSSRFSFMAPAECDHLSVGVGLELVPRWLLQVQAVCVHLRELYSPPMQDRQLNQGLYTS